VLMAREHAQFRFRVEKRRCTQAGRSGLTQNDYIRAALKVAYNWIGLAGAGGICPSCRDGPAPRAGRGLEMMCLALVPQSSVPRLSALEIRREKPRASEAPG